MKNLIVPFLILVTSCELTPAPVGIPSVNDSEFCLPAAQKLDTLPNKCGHRQAIKGKFAEFCKSTQTNGIYLNPKCISAASNCDQVKACEVQ
jgi:hypothetical protein